VLASVVLTLPTTLAAVTVAVVREQQRLGGRAVRRRPRRLG
jgi:hypothetical protein